VAVTVTLPTGAAVEVHEAMGVVDVSSAVQIRVNPFVKATVPAGTATWDVTEEATVAV
jgi:hypothetical protein